MNRSGGEAFAKLAQQLNRARMQAGGGGRGGGSGGNPFGGLPGGGKGAATGGGLIALLAVGGIALNYSLFNGGSQGHGGVTPWRDPETGRRWADADDIQSMVVIERSSTLGCKVFDRTSTRKELI